MNGLNWNWIGVMLVGPPIVAALAAWLIWQTRQYLIGNLAGAAVAFGSALALILRESVELNHRIQACLDAGYTCWPDPSAFTRYAIYAFIALFQTFGIFIWSLRVEARIRSRNYAPEWR